MTLSVNISGLEAVAEAINNLAQAMNYKLSVSLKDMTAACPEGQQAAQTGTFGAAAGMAGGLPGAGSAPAAQSSAPQAGWPGAAPQAGVTTPVSGMTAGPIPTTAAPHTYTQDQIAVAMTGLVDQGKQPQVMQILAQFGAASLMQVPKEQYQALAAQLRMLGAAI